MMLRDRAVTTTSRYLGLEDFEAAGIRVAERHFGAKDLIFSPGDPDGQLYFLLEGTVRLYKLYGGYKEATVALLQDHGVFGELSLEDGLWQNVFAETVTYVRVAVVRKSALSEIMKHNPELALKLLTCFSERLEQADEVIASLLDREVSTRLATLLSNLGDRFGETNGSDKILNVRLTHQDLANMIVSTREAVSKAMSEFQRDGLVEVRNRTIAISPRLANTPHRS
jgi:CRP/FNR family transcriptional regulator, global nitrogen regulator